MRHLALLALAACAPEPFDPAELASPEVGPPGDLTPGMDLTYALRGYRMRPTARGDAAALSPGASGQLLVSSTAPDGTQACTGLGCYDLPTGARVIGTANVRADGEIVFTYTVPAQLAFTTVWFQIGVRQGGALRTTPVVQAPVLGEAGDYDRDGITNRSEHTIFIRERFNHTSPLLADTDGDGLSDAVEPAAAFSDSTLFDTDGDGLDDGEEYALGTNARRVDTDGGGVSDFDEVALGTDPLDPIDG